MPKTIAIVCDDGVFRCMMSRLLVLYIEGLHIECFHSGLGILKALDSGKGYDVVLMDYTLEGSKTGVWYTSQIFEQYPEVKVLGFSYDNLRENEFIKAGAVRSVSKTASLQENLRIIKEVLV